jgi:hypothetical protein
MRTHNVDGNLVRKGEMFAQVEVGKGTTRESSGSGRSRPGIAQDFSLVTLPVQGPTLCIHRPSWKDKLVRADEEQPQPTRVSPTGLQDEVSQTSGGRQWISSTRLS